MKRSNPDIVDQTIHLWRHRTKETISRQDAREMVNNIAGFFQVLSDWNREIQNEVTPGEKDKAKVVQRCVSD